MTEATTDPVAPPDPWFEGAGLGMFLHWDHASQQGLEVSWPMVGGVFSLPLGQDVTVEQYRSSAATFDPVAWDPAVLAATAKRAGMRYAVFGTRHHNGYSMWDTAVSDRKVTASPYGRDIVRSFVDAFRAEGLRIGFYYSLSDWQHPDYPAWTEEMRPYRLGMSPPRPTDEQAERFRAYLMAQLTELLTQYGRIDVLWFDGQWERSWDWWDTPAIAALARRLHPGIRINDRLTGCGDFDTPEQFVPPTPPGRAWETCLTMNESWGYNPADTRYKSTRALIHTVAEVVGRGGNLLLNVSPRGDGSLPPEQVERLDGLARWTARHADAIHDVRPALEPWQFYGPTTRKGDRIYLFCLSRPYDSITVRGVPIRRIESATVVGTGQVLKLRTRCGIIESLMPDPDGEVTIFVPEGAIDPDATVIALDVRPAP